VVRRGLWFVLAPVLAWTCVAGRVLIVSVPVGSPDLIVSLASHEWERLPAAAEAARRFPSAQLVLTHPPAVTVYNCHDCEHRIDRLVAAGVDASRVTVVPLTVDGTRGEALAVRAFAEPRGVRQLLVVTSPYHTRRALGVFQRAFAGSGVTIGIEPATAYAHVRPGVWFAGAEDRWYVTYEWAALVYYGARYGILPG